MSSVGLTASHAVQMYAIHGDEGVFQRLFITSEVSYSAQEEIHVNRSCC